MHDMLRQRLWRHIEALPEQQMYQVLDYIEFLSSKYARETVRSPASSLQRFGERLEDRMRGQGVGLQAIRGTLDAVNTANRVFAGLAEAGRSLAQEVEDELKGPPARAPRPALPPAAEPAPRTATELDSLES
jgi:hypothetical protein